MPMIVNADIGELAGNIVAAVRLVGTSLADNWAASAGDGSVGVGATDAATSNFVDIVGFHLAVSTYRQPTGGSCC